MEKLFEPKKKRTLEEKLNLGFSFVYFLVVIGILILIGLAIWGSIYTDGGVDSFDSNATFAVILAGITITLASSIIIPKVLLKNEVETAVNLLKKGLKDEFRKEELKKFLTDNLVLDGHMSRMISLLLLETSKKENKTEHIYSVVWSLGWAIRSYKKYILASQGETITGENVSLEQYRDLVMVIHENTQRSSSMFFESLDGLENVSKLIPILLSKDLGFGISERNMALFYRTIKETLDIQYEIFYEWKKKGGKPEISSKSESLIAEWMVIVSPIVAVLIGLILNKLESDLGNMNKAKGRLLDEVTRRSNFSKDDDYKTLIESRLNHILNVVNTKNWSFSSIKHIDSIFDRSASSDSLDRNLLKKVFANFS